LTTGAFGNDRYARFSLELTGSEDNLMALDVIGPTEPGATHATIITEFAAGHDNARSGGVAPVPALTREPSFSGD